MSKIVCISYFPTSTTISMAELAKMSPEEILNYFQNIEPSLPSSCAWTLKNNEAHPVLIMNKAEQIFNNIMAWSENDPKKWFYFGIKHDNEKYSLGLFPNLVESLKRFKENQEALQQRKITNNDEVQILFHPLGFMSGLDTYNNIKELLPDNIDIGISESVESIRKDEIYWIQQIQRSRKGHKINYVEDYLRSALN